MVGIEHQSALVTKSIENLNNDDPNMLSSQQVSIIGGFASSSITLFGCDYHDFFGIVISLEGDGRKGYEPLAPYHAIHVGAASPEKPVNLISQLAEGGRLIVPVGPEGGDQHMMQVSVHQLFHH